MRTTWAELGDIDDHAAIIGAVVYQGDDGVDAVCCGELGDVVKDGDAVRTIVGGCGVLRPELVLHAPVLESRSMKCNEQTNEKTHQVRTVVRPAFVILENVVPISFLGCPESQYTFVLATL